MAERRMFAKSVIGSARFLRLPVGARLLYFDLGMQADDDGVVEAFSVLRTTGAAESDLQMLASKGFVRVLNDDLVTFITDWSRNNYIQKDRYRPSIYGELLRGAEGVDTGGIQRVSRVDTQVRSGEGRKGERGAGKPPSHRRFEPPTVEQVAEYVRMRGSCVDPQGFIDFYESKGWMIGRTPMKDWKAACRNAESWERWKKTERSGKGDPYGPYF